MCASSPRAKQRMKEAVRSQPALCKLLCKAESASCFSQLHYWCRLLLPRWLCLCLCLCVPVIVHTCMSPTVSHLCCSGERVVSSSWSLVTFSPPLPASLCALLSFLHLLSFFSTCNNVSPLPPPLPPPPPPPPLSLSGLHLSLTDVLSSTWEGIPLLSAMKASERELEVKKNQTRTTATQLPHSAVSK